LGEDGEEFSVMQGGDAREIMIEVKGKHEGANIHYDPDRTILVFMDESGTSTMKGDRRNSLKRYFNLAALLCYQSEYERQIIPKVEEWKRQSFPEIYGRGESVYLHASDLIHGKGMYEDWSDEQKATLYRSMLELVHGFRTQLVTICIDKQGLAEKVIAFDQAEWEVAYETALALHIERLVIFLEKHRRKSGKSYQVRITVESRDPAQNRQVDAIYDRLRTYGNKLWRSVTTAQVNRIIPALSLDHKRKLDRVHGLELIDQFANPLLNLTRHEYGCLSGELRWQEIMVRDMLGDKIATNNEGEKRGHGLKLYP
ncbi:MAG: hypothetical protein ACOZB3_02105, partial [Calditrichota bacterium]